MQDKMTDRIGLCFAKTVLEESRAKSSKQHLKKTDEYKQVEVATITAMLQKLLKPQLITL